MLPTAVLGLHPAPEKHEQKMHKETSCCLYHSTPFSSVTYQKYYDLMCKLTQMVNEQRETKEGKI